MVLPLARSTIRKNWRFDSKSRIYKGLQDLQDIVAQAEMDGKRVRAYGSKYTMNNMLYTSQYLVQSWGLNYHKIGIEQETHVTEAYNETRDCLVFVQSGVRIKTLNQKLFDAGLALKTSTTLDAPRIVGAVATASHGSNLDVGPLHATVKAIHIVMMGGATLMTYDDMFEAVLVSFGSFGLIHGMLIEVEPLYELAMQTKKCDYDDAKSVLKEPLDIRKLGFEGIQDGELPYHFEITINSYRRKHNGVYARVFRKLPITQTQQESAALRASRQAISTDSFENL
jgi:FAD/FMN-containing dehydrogenase